MALHLFVEKVAVFTLARNNDTDIPEDVAETLFQYAKLNISQTGTDTYNFFEKFVDQHSVTCAQTRCM